MMTFLALALIACNGGGGDTAVEGVETEDLGSFTTDAEELTPDIPFTVPADTSSAVVYCGPFGDTLLGTAWEIKDADGNYIYTNAFHESFVPTKMRVGNLDDLVPVLMPVSPDADLSAGDHTMKMWIASGTTTQVSCHALYRTAKVSSKGSIDLHFVFVGVDLTADTAPDDPDFSAALDQVKTLWKAGGLDVGSVSYADFDGDVSKYTVVDVSPDDPGELNDLLRTASSRQALTLFMVQEISSSDGSTILGQAAGPPGLPTVGGTSKSGMVVTTADLHDDPATVALIIAHEGGHFLGLFHTTEKNGEIHDPLGDTLQCSTDEDSDGNGTLTPSECAAMDGSNLMFWGAQTTSTELSDDQSWVLRRNPDVF